MMLVVKVCSGCAVSVVLACGGCAPGAGFVMGSCSVLDGVLFRLFQIC